MAQYAAAAPDVNLFAKAGALGALAAGNLQQQPETPHTGIGIETPHGSGTKGKAGAGKEGTDDDDDNPDGDPIEWATGCDPIVDGVVEL
jgi:hypothetical protein